MAIPLTASPMLAAVSMSILLDGPRPLHVDYPLTTGGPTSSLPLTGSDEGEEVTVTWERIEFIPSASRVD